MKYVVDPKLKIEIVFSVPQFFSATREFVLPLLMLVVTTNDFVTHKKAIGSYFGP